MSTTPTPAPTTAQVIQQDIQKYLPIFELFANVGLTAASAAGAVPVAAPALASAIEGGLNPLIASIGAGNSTTQEEVVAISSAISVLNVLKANTRDPVLLAKIEAYTVAGQAALNGYLDASKGYNPANFQPVTPIV